MAVAQDIIEVRGVMDYEKLFWYACYMSDVVEGKELGNTPKSVGADRNLTSMQITEMLDRAFAEPVRRELILQLAKRYQEMSIPQTQRAGDSD